MSIRSSSEADARPVRTVLNSLRACSTDLPMRVSASPISWSTVAIRCLLPCLDDGTDVLAGDDSGDVAVRELENVNGEPVVHAQRERCRVHDLEAALDRLEMGEARQEPCLGIHVRVAVVDALDAVLRHQDRVGTDLQGAQRCRRVRREERIAGARGKDDDAPLLEMPDRAPPDIGLRDLPHLERRLDSRVRALPLQHVLQRERVEQRREHPGVIGGRPLHAFRRGRHAAVEVAATHDDRNPHAAGVHRRDFLGEPADDRNVDAVLARPHQRLTRQLQHNAAEDGAAVGRGSNCRLLGSNGHAESAKTSNSSTSAPPSFKACPTVFDESWIHSWSRSTFAPKKRLLSIPSTILSRACSGFDCTSSEFAKISRSAAIVSSGTSSRAIQRGRCATMCIATLRPSSSSPPRTCTSAPNLLCGACAYAWILAPSSASKRAAPTTAMFSPSFTERATRSSSSSLSAPTPFASTASSTFFAYARNSSLFETGSVSHPTATMVPFEPSSARR